MKEVETWDQCRQLSNVVMPLRPHMLNNNRKINIITSGWQMKRMTFPFSAVYSSGSTLFQITFCTIPTNRRTNIIERTPGRETLSKHKKKTGDTSPKLQEDSNINITWSLSGIPEILYNPRTGDCNEIANYLTNKRDSEVIEAPRCNRKQRLRYIYVEDITLVVISFPKMSASHYLTRQLDVVGKIICNAVLPTLTFAHLHWSLTRTQRDRCPDSNAPQCYRKLQHQYRCRQAIFPMQGWWLWSLDCIDDIRCVYYDSQRLFRPSLWPCEINIIIRIASEFGEKDEIRSNSFLSLRREIRATKYKTMGSSLRKEYMDLETKHTSRRRDWSFQKLMRTHFKGNIHAIKEQGSPHQIPTTETRSSIGCARPRLETSTTLLSPEKNVFQLLSSHEA